MYIYSKRSGKGDLVEEESIRKKYLNKLIPKN